MPDVLRALLLTSGVLLAAGTAVAAEDESSRTANIEMYGSQDVRAPRPKGAQSIAILVNDEPITAYEIEQRATFIAVQGGGGGNANEFKAKAEARWKAIIKDPKTNERFKQLLEKNNVQTREAAQELQKKYVKDLQQNMVAQLKREQRSGATAGSRVKAQDELIEEKLKLQEAKRLNALAEDADVDKIVTGIAERNKMTLEQFGQHMKGMGVDISTMKSRFRAEISWREVIRRRFGHLVAITERDVDHLVANTSLQQNDVELHVQRLTLPLPSSIDQAVIAQRIAEADGLRQKYAGCASMSGLAAASPGALFEDLGQRKPATIPEPTRSLLLSAAEGDLLPASVGQSGIELWALCARKAIGDAPQMGTRENAENELRQREFEVLAQRHLKDLRQDAAIEIR